MTITHNKDWQYDLDFGEDGEHWLSKLSGNGKVEVKTERNIWATSGNLAIEVYDERKNKGNGAPSGIMTTKADWWVHILKADGEEDGAIVAPTSMIKRLVDEATEVVPMGDIDSEGRSARGVLIPIRELTNEMQSSGKRRLNGKSRT